MESTTFQKQYPLALVALGEHMAAHELPVPWMVDTRGTDLIVLLNRGTAESWLASVVVDGEHTEERHPAGEEAIRTEWDVRLPDTGIRLTLVSYRPVPVWVPSVVSA